MIYSETIQGFFLERPNRFIAWVVPECPEKLTGYSRTKSGEVHSGRTASGGSHICSPDAVVPEDGGIQSDNPDAGGPESGSIHKDDADPNVGMAESGRIHLRKANEPIREACEPIKVHVKNTGRCREILVPGTRVILEKGKSPGRKTNYSLIAAYKGRYLINIDSQAPNQVVWEALSSGKLCTLPGFSTEGEVPLFVRKEVVYDRSRFDLYYETLSGEKCFVEVKGVTLEKNGVMMFPDAPTERGTKHVYEMIRAVREGYRGVILFVVQMKGGLYFTPNSETDPDFAEAINEARNSGVEIRAWNCSVSENSLELCREIPILLNNKSVFS